ncbi:MAG: Fur family transcriptional regulator [Peptoniphilaceae bacterium]|nr:Fur family transcriptional regulator [Peptoniphilaceae bacterium]MDY6019238.1 Fur family transcriptional regulator [Anaerococcus sp.]
MHTEEILKDKGLRVTKPRSIILETIYKLKRPISAEEIYKIIGENNQYLNLSTVYRNLKTLVDKNVLLKNTDLDGVSYFQLNIQAHKHFITCIKCGKKVTIENCPIDEFSHQVEEETGFTVRSHNFEFTGICPDCMKNL